MLNLNNDNPLYLQLAKIISDQISKGELSEGKKLASENEYSKQFNINRNTVRQALQKLKEDGLIYSKQGKGNFVSNLKIAYNVSEKTRYSSEMLNLGLTPSAKLLTKKLIKADKEIASNLEINVKDSVVMLEILRFADDFPLCLTTSYLSAKKYSKLIDLIEGDTFSLTTLLNENFSVNPVRSSTVFEAQMPTDSELLKLKISKHIPLLVTKSRSKLNSGEIVEYGISKFRGDLAQMKISM